VRSDLQKRGLLPQLAEQIRQDKCVRMLLKDAKITQVTAEEAKELKAEGKERKAKSEKQRAKGKSRRPWPFALCALPFALCTLPSVSRSILHPDIKA